MEDGEFNRALREHQIDRSIFTLGRPPEDGMYTIQLINGQFEVYYFERGVKEFARTFSERARSLDYLLELLLADPRAKNGFGAGPNS
ncbi:hypothetical protein QQM79_20630 [Marinobacteraceae bacterium S3BR75-40.1]